MNIESDPERSPLAAAAPARSAFDWARAARVGPELAGEVRALVRRRRRRRFTIGLATACVVGCGFLFWPAGSGPEVPTSVTVADSTASVSLPARRDLPDGSTVELRPGAEIGVDFSGTVRRVTLLRGVAHFQVAKNAARPFVVTAHGVDVRAVGTAFSVELSSQTVEVVVTEGRVALGKLAEPAASGAPPDAASALATADRQVAAGQHAVVSFTAPVAPDVHAISTEEMARRLAWRVPRLDFSGTPLPAVVALFRQHGGVQLTIGDSSLEHVRVSGILRADNTTALLQLLAADHGIGAERRGDVTVLFRER